MAASTLEASTGFSAPPDWLRPPSPEIRPPLLGYTALVLGGTDGIGAETAIEFARQGAANVIIVGRDPLKRDAVVPQIQEAGKRSGTQVFSVLADISTREGVALAIDGIKGIIEPDSVFMQEGQEVIIPGGEGLAIDALVLAPGITEDEFAEKVTFDRHAHVLNTNLIGPTQFAIGLKNAKLFAPRASITALSSIVGEITPNHKQIKYAGSKAGLAAEMEVLAQEWAQDGIRVNSICPGFVDTRLTHKMLNEPRVRKALLQFTPMTRAGVPSDIAPLIAFLANEDTSSFITGGTYVVDGGLGGKAPAIYEAFMNGWDQLDIDEKMAVKALREAARAAAEQPITE